MGENGIGKTTLIRCLTGALQPRSGTIRFFGKTLTSWNRRDLFQRVGVVISEPESYPWQMTGNELMAHASRFYDQWDDAFVARLADEFQIDLRKPLRHLSSGEHAKIRLLRAMGLRPRLLLLDELTANLSGPSAVAVTKAVIGRLADDGAPLSVVYVSHARDEAERLSDRIHVLDGAGLNALSPELSA